MTLSDLERQDARSQIFFWRIKVKVKVHTLDIAPLRIVNTTAEALRYMARVLKGSHSFTCTPTLLSAIGMCQTCLCLPSRSWYSFADPGGMDWKAE